MGLHDDTLVMLLFILFFMFSIFGSSDLLKFDLILSLKHSADVYQGMDWHMQLNRNRSYNVDSSGKDIFRLSHELYRPLQVYCHLYHGKN